MIKPEELRLFNWVEYKIHGKDEWIAAPVVSLNLDSGKHFRPIPLTPEILEKCGFEKRSSIDLPELFEYVLDEETLNLILTHEGGSFFYWNHSCLMVDPSFNYVHELQNFIFALTGEELEINL